MDRGAVGRCTLAKDFQIFLPGEPYNAWESNENVLNRLVTIRGECDAKEGRDTVKDAEILKNMQKDLRFVCSIIGKCALQIMIFRQKGYFFFNILYVQYESSDMTPISFYNQYRTFVSNNLARNGYTIKYKNNLVLQADERMTTMLEDIILLDAIWGEIDVCFSAQIKADNIHKIGSDKLMDFSSDIMVNIPTFLYQFEKGEALYSLMENESSLSAFRPGQQRRQRNNTKTLDNKKICGN